MFKKFLDNLIVVIMASVLFFIFNSSTSANELTFAQVSDVHYSRDKINTSYRLNKESCNLLNDTILQINSNKKINFTIFTGDMINKSRKEDLFEFIEIANLNIEIKKCRRNICFCNYSLSFILPH